MIYASVISWSWEKILQLNGIELVFMPWRKIEVCQIHHHEKSHDSCLEEKFGLSNSFVMIMTNLNIHIDLWRFCNKNAFILYSITLFESGLIPIIVERLDWYKKKALICQITPTLSRLKVTTCSFKVWWLCVMGLQSANQVWGIHCQQISWFSDLML